MVYANANPRPSSFSVSRRMPRLLLCAALTLAGAALAQPAELAPAPQADVPQDTSSWYYRAKPKAALTRSAVASLYQTMYVPQAAVPLTWTGSIAGCNPGTSDAAHQSAVLGRVNYFRALAGLPAVLQSGPTQTAQEQAAALMMSANNALSHTPPAGWTCYSAAGATGAGQSNIALGANGVEAVDMYMDDFGGGNTAAGHRRWILYPPQQSMTTGDVGFGAMPSNALYVFAPQAARPATPNGIAWPPAGYVPYQNLPAHSNRWSISYPGANFSSASVSVSGPNGSFPVSYEAIQNGYGDNTLVFLPAGFPYGKPAVDTTYTVAVTGATGPGVPNPLTYTVTVIDPAAAGSATSARSDFNADGRSDVFWRRSDGVNALWNVSGTGTSQYTTTFLPGVANTWRAVGTGDVNGDGVADVVWYHPSSGQVAIWMMTSASSVASVTFPASVGAGTSWSPSTLADLDGDGRVEIVWRDGNGRTLAWYLNPNGSLASSRDYGLAAAGYELRGAGDFNNDGIDDLLFFRPDDGVVAIWLMAANGTYTGAFPGAVGPGNWRPHRVADLDGDGTSDILWREEVSGLTAAWYINAGSLSTYDFFISVPFGQWQLGTAGDFNLDGREDLLWYSPQNGSVVRWIMNGRHVAPTMQTLTGVGTEWQMVP